MNTYGYALANPLYWIDPFGLWGVGLQVNATAELGTTRPSGGATGTAGFGIFSHSDRPPQYGELEGFATGAAQAYSLSPDVNISSANATDDNSCNEDDEFIAGAYAGVSAGIFLTNMTIEELSGFSPSWNMNIGIGPFRGSFSISSESGLWSFSGGGGPGAYGSISRYCTATVVTEWEPPRN